MRAVLAPALQRGIRIVTNMGAANPVAAARRTVVDRARAGLSGSCASPRCAATTCSPTSRGDYRFEETGTAVRDLGDRILSANAYLGAGPICAALETGAQVSITGRAADPALFLAPLVHEFGWSMDDWAALGQGTVVGHLLECAGQITGGYFADPGVKHVPDLARLGFPIGEVQANGDLVITKVAGSGGCVSAATCKEQLLYEIHDPAQYLQPDVVADFSSVRIEEIGADRVRVSRRRGRRADRDAQGLGRLHRRLRRRRADLVRRLGRGRARAPRARDRARAAPLTGVRMSESRFDLVGVDALHGAAGARRGEEPYEVRLRVTGRADSMQEAAPYRQRGRDALHQRPGRRRRRLQARATRGGRRAVGARSGERGRRLRIEIVEVAA